MSVSWIRTPAKTSFQLEEHSNSTIDIWVHAYNQFVETGLHRMPARSTYIFVPFRLYAMHARHRGDDIGVVVAEAVEKRCVVNHLIVAVRHQHLRGTKDANA